MMASAGFDSEIVAALSPELKRRVGRLAFAWGFLVRLWHCPACELTVRADGVEYRAAAVVAAKGRHYAGPFVVAPGADLAEPVLELVLLDRRGRWAMLRYATALFLGRVPRLGDIAIVRVRQASVAGNRALPVQADGEIVGELPITLAVADRPLLLIRPAG